MQQVVFLGSKPIGYHCLSHLIEHYHNKTIQIQGLLTNDNSVFGATTSLVALAHQHQIPIINSLDDLTPTDILYSVQYHEILLPRHIQQARVLAVNLHMAPLPEYRGCNQFSFALLDQQQEFGTTIHILDPQIDHGAILFEKRFPIPQNCWIEELYDLTYNASLDLFKHTIDDILHLNFTPKAQASLEATRGTSIHYRKEIHQIKEIDLNWDKEKIERHIRATAMPGFEPPYAIINNQKVFFTRVEH